MTAMGSGGADGVDDAWKRALVRRTRARDYAARTLIGTENMWPLLMTRAWDDDGDLSRVSCSRVGLRKVPKADAY
jgi:hypothetical protein